VKDLPVKELWSIGSATAENLERLRKLPQKAGIQDLWHDDERVSAQVLGGGVRVLRDRQISRRVLRLSRNQHRLPQSKDA